jgi:hypothetical protein
MAEETPLPGRTCVECHKKWEPSLEFAGYTGTMRDQCENCRFDSVAGLWTEATSWEHIVALMFNFICGRIFCTPDHGGPLDPESTQLILGLERLHEYGIITYDSQPYNHSSGTRGKYDWEEKQRPYLVFHIPTKHPQIPEKNVKALVKALLERENVFTTIWSDWDTYPESEDDYEDGTDSTLDEQDGMQKVAALHNTDDLYAFQSSTASRSHPGVTKNREVAGGKRLQDVPYAPCTRLQRFVGNSWDVGYFAPQEQGVDWPFVSVSGVPEGTPMYDLAEKMRVLTIQVWAKRWDEDIDLPALVEQACIKVRLQRVFHDIEQWTKVKSDDSVHPKTLVITAEDVQYEEPEILSAPSCIVN